MERYKLAEIEEKFADLIWRNEPIRSGDLVKLCEVEMKWKKSTTYTVLRKLCDRGIFQNNNTVVSSLQTKEAYLSIQSIHFVEDTFGGSLPLFLAAFIKGKMIGGQQVEELLKIIDAYHQAE